MDDLIRKYDKYKGRTDLDNDASYEAWTGLYLPVYSKIDVFRENFEFRRPCLRPFKKGIQRIAVSAKKDSVLMKNFQKELGNRGIDKEISLVFRLSGETDFNIQGVDCHLLSNYSMMPITGSMNNEKGCCFDDNWAQYVYAISDKDGVIRKPEFYTPMRKYKDYSEDIVIAARRAYYNLFDNDIYNYCRNVYFFGVESDETERIIKKALKSEGKIEGEDYIKLAREYWNLRAKILKENYGINKL